VQEGAQEDTLEPSTSHLSELHLALSEEERDAAGERFRVELEAEHQRRHEKIQRRQEKARAKRYRKKSENRQVELYEIQEQIRQQFYKDNNYQLYTDSTGRQSWLSPEEYEWRMARRKNRGQKRKIYEPAFGNRRPMWLFYAGMLALAIVLGIALAK
jgi:hypothetical protein